MIAELRADLDPLPDRLKGLSVHRGYPVPWFVDIINGEPEFRAMSREKWARAVKEKLCWVCGQPLGKHLVFVAGPMCGINRTSGEPPCHLECAQWSVRNCPFLSKPQMTRRENALPEGCTISPFHLDRNPGVTLLWITKSYELFGDGQGGVLIEMGPAERVEWYAFGKPATRQQVEDSVAGGIGKLEEMAHVDGAGALEELAKLKATLVAMYPLA